MSQDNKKKKFIQIVSQISNQRQKEREGGLSDHAFYIQKTKEQISLFDHLMFRAILEQAEGLSLTYGKPFQYNAKDDDAPRLSKEAFEALEKSAIFRPTRLGILSLIG